jgi:hypothetical protein
MRNLFDKIITEPLKDFFQRIIEFLPNLLSALIIFILGLILAWVIKVIIVRISKVMRLDRLFSKIGLTGPLEKIGLKEAPAKMVGRMFYWLIVILFAAIALYALKVPAIEDFLGKFLLYLPNLFIAAVLLIIGYMLGNFLARATLIASVNAGIKFSGLLSKGVKTLIILFAFVMALEQLGIGRGTVVAGFIILFGGLVLALSLAFGLGGKDIAREYLEKKFKKEAEKKDDLKHV